ncbi:TetR/AcrR family transcriptional regulator [Nocardioides sp. WS12]|uniref:TetR/AcrR family transcriptional regulator n=1 Tax=Nocardioides sp. WS12 TaxID=2486272 RepID=UPI0015FDA586|nr:TetR/AcrR family transcriptional regulator [Nocardioides sp. WS12]
MAGTRHAHTRKPPQQQRSEEMVDRIIDAGARILLRYGYDGASTNKIASEAGVSPGSLYYYFSDKDGVLRAVLDRFLKNLGTAVTTRTSGATKLDRAAFIAAADTLITLLEENRRYLEVLINEAPRLVSPDSRESVEQRLHDHMRLGFLLAGSTLTGAELEARCWLATQLCLAVPVKYVLTHGPIPRDLFLEGLADQVDALAGLA